MNTGGHMNVATMRRQSDAYLMIKVFTRFVQFERSGKTGDPPVYATESHMPFLSHTLLTAGLPVTASYMIFKFACDANSALISGAQFASMAE